MAITVLQNAREESTYVLSIDFLNENSSPVTPTSATWTLSDINGNIINGRVDVNISPLSTTVDIPLTGDDLAISDPVSLVRRFTVEALYDSTLGNGLKLNDEVEFSVDDLVNVT